MRRRNARRWSDPRRRVVERPPPRWMVRDCVAGDAQEPSTKRCQRRVVASEGPQGLQEDLRGDVLNRLPGGHSESDIAIDPRPVFVVPALEGPREWIGTVTRDFGRRIGRDRSSTVRRRADLHPRRLGCTRASSGPLQGGSADRLWRQQSHSRRAEWVYSLEGSRVRRVPVPAGARPLPSFAAAVCPPPSALTTRGVSQ